MAIAFIVLFAITASFAALFYYDYNATMSSLNACEVGATSSVSPPSEQTLVNDQTISEAPSEVYNFNFNNIPYAGYIEVIVTSTTPNTTVQISGRSIEGWSYHSGVMLVGTSGTVYFPVAPGFVSVGVGNNNPSSGATMTVTIIYHS
jgi:hypothetical protein